MADYAGLLSQFGQNNVGMYNPMQGYGQGLGLMYGVSGLDAENRDRDLQYQMQQNAYQNQLADNPVLASGRALTMAQQGNQKQSYDNGLQTAALNAGLKEKTTEANSKAANITREDQAQNVWEASQLMDAYTKRNPNAGQLEKQSYWNSNVKPRLDSVNVKLGDNYGPDHEAWLKDHANMAFNSLQQQRALAKTNAEYEGRAKIEGMKDISAEKRSAETNATRLQVAQTNAQRLNSLSAMAVQIMQKPGPLTTQDEANLSEYFKERFDATSPVAKNTMSLFYTRAMEDPKDPDHALAVLANKDPETFLEMKKNVYVKDGVDSIKKSKAAAGVQQQQQPQPAPVQPQAQPQAVDPKEAALQQLMKQNPGMSREEILKRVAK